jgi:OOP family OmpA-OmpF porin
LNLAVIFVLFNPKHCIMKKLLAAIIACCFFTPAILGQDDEIRQPAIGISFFLKDYRTADLIRTQSLSAVLRDDKWTSMGQMDAGMAISYFKGLKKHIDYAITLGGSFVRVPVDNVTPTNRKFLLEADATMNLKMTSEKYWLQPYIIAGIGAYTYSSEYGAFIPLGLGLKVNFFDDLHMFITSQYRVPVTTQSSAHHFHNSLGFAMPLGKKQPKVIPPPPPPLPPPDRDGDGIPDSEDECPDVPGLARYKGCPIPDRDGDGINDEEDECPDVPGLARYKGCPIPDRDGDGINDEEDACPDVPGLAKYKGCPPPDRDGDGIPDDEDKCPDLPGTKENMGCPEIKEEIKKTVGFAAKNILFVTASYQLRSTSFKGLNDVVKIMQDNPAMKLAIDGHTDNVGKEDYNQTLSENRANAVKNYFISKGIDESRITAQGHGLTKPIADNKTAAGRQLNRRVEMKLTYY